MGSPFDPNAARTSMYPIRSEHRLGSEAEIKANHRGGPLRAISRLSGSISTWCAMRRKPPWCLQKRTYHTLMAWTSIDATVS